MYVTAFFLIAVCINMHRYHGRGQGLIESSPRVSASSRSHDKERLYKDDIKKDIKHPKLPINFETRFA